MKQIIILAIFTLSSIVCYSQPLDGVHQGRGKNNSGLTRQEIESQKIAYFTQELELTPDEAQKFWPIYNAQGKERHEARKATLHSLRLLTNALESESEISDKDIETLVNSYQDKFNAENKLFNKNYEEIKKILPLKKAAKIFNAEEKFRVVLIRQLRGPREE